MRKATIDQLDIVGRLARQYIERGQPTTVIEVAVKTSAAVGDRVKLPDINAERTVIGSRWVAGVKVVHISAIDWLILRGAIVHSQSQLDTARNIAPAQREPVPPRSRAKTRGKARAGTG